jgi:hypothetical protein
MSFPTFIDIYNKRVAINPAHVASLQEDGQGHVQIVLASGDKIMLPMRLDNVLARLTGQSDLKTVA